MVASYDLLRHGNGAGLYLKVKISEAVDK